MIVRLISESKQFSLLPGADLETTSCRSGLGKGFEPLQIQALVAQAAIHFDGQRFTTEHIEYRPSGRQFAKKPALENVKFRQCRSILSLRALIVVTLIAFWRIRPLAGALLALYLLWVSFAAALNEYVRQLNLRVLG